MNENTVSTTDEFMSETPPTKTIDHPVLDPMHPKISSSSEMCLADKTDPLAPADPKQPKKLFKNMLKSHNLDSLINRKRSRKPVEKQAKVPLQKPIDAKKSVMTRNANKCMKKTKGKPSLILNKIFYKSAPAEEKVSYVHSLNKEINTKELFENIYIKIRKKVHLNDGDREVPIYPETVLAYEKHLPDINCNPLLFKPRSPVKLQNSALECFDSLLLNHNNSLEKFKANGQKSSATEQNALQQTSQVSSNGHERIDSLEEAADAPKPETKPEQNGKAHLDIFTSNGSLILGQRQYPTYICCDLRYFNFDFLVDKIGNCDVILMDPPWNLVDPATIHLSESTPVPAISSPETDILTNSQILNIRVDKLSKKGFIFLWIPQYKLNFAYEVLNRWGYEVVDQIIWVKLKGDEMFLGEGRVFTQSFEMCLVGYKCPPGEYVEYNSKISNNLIFSEVKGKNRKPNEIYEIIELMMPGAKKIELFAKNQSLRLGWFAIGNKLGENYDKWVTKVECNNCEEPIETNIKRYKSKKTANFDVCEPCFHLKNYKTEDFFVMVNNLNNDVVHLHYTCASCKIQPILGPRFQCRSCVDYSICETCYDLNLQPGHNMHDPRHDFEGYEYPLHGDSVSAHGDKKCYFCFQKPILGPCYVCVPCSNFNICQNCLFTKTLDDFKKYKGHKLHHNFEIQVESSPESSKSAQYRCAWCDPSVPIQGTAYKCDQCFNFYFCEKCYFKRHGYRTDESSHTLHHSFTVIQF